MFKHVANGGRCIVYIVYNVYTERCLAGRTYKFSLSISSTKLNKISAKTSPMQIFRL